MFISKIPQIKQGFTLIEILIVIAILGLLMGITTHLLSSAGDSQNQANAKTEMATIAQALEEFKSECGDYPHLNMADKENEEASELYKCLIGKKIMEVENNQISWISPDNHRAYIDASKFRLRHPSDKENENVDSEKDGVYLADPWNEPYLYFYTTSTTVGDQDSQWEKESFILMTKGADLKAKDVDDMYSTGSIPDRSVYKKIDENIDNIIYRQGSF